MSKKYIPLIVRSTDGNCIRTSTEQYGSWVGAKSATLYPCAYPPDNGDNIMYGDDTNTSGNILTTNGDASFHRFGLFAPQSSASDKSLFYFKIVPDGDGNLIQFGNKPNYTIYRDIANRPWENGYYIRNEGQIFENDADFQAVINAFPIKDKKFNFYALPSVIEDELQTIANNGQSRIPLEEQNNFVASVCGNDRPRLQYGYRTNGLSSDDLSSYCKSAIAARPGKFDLLVNNYCKNNPTDEFCQCYRDINVEKPKMVEIFQQQGLPLPSVSCWNSLCKNPMTTVYQPASITNDNQPCANVTICNQSLSIKDIDAIASNTTGTLVCGEKKTTSDGQTTTTNQPDYNYSGAPGASNTTTIAKNQDVMKIYLLYFLIFLSVIVIGYVIAQYVMVSPTA